MKEIKLKQGQITFVDDEDYVWLNQYVWSYDPKNYAVHYTLGKMHRLILGLTDRFIYVDHIDMNGLNNQRSNLRTATPSQNRMNTKPFGAVKYKGVHIEIVNGKEQIKSQIYLNKKSIFLGYFDTIEDAAKCYNLAAIKYFGEFAYLNQV